MFDEYNESAEEAATIARLALPWISRNSLPAIPVNYAVAYELLSGRNKQLKSETDKLQKDNKKITQSLLYALFKKYFSGGVNHELIKNIRIELIQIFSEAIEVITSSGVGMDEYREKLEYANTKLNDEMDLNVLRDVVSEMIAETRRMQESSKQLQLHLNATCDELDTLRSDFQKVQNEIFNDPLTGILNRRGLSKLLEQMKLNEAEQDSVSVLMIDIDNFKQFNDSFGHIIGDEVIKFVTNTITDNLKGRDITVRFGGEEFLVILPDTALNMAERVALKLCHAMKAAPLTQTSTRRKLGHITISIGVTSNHHKEQMENIIERADSALYEAKKSGRDRVFSFPLAGDISHEVA